MNTKTSSYVPNWQLRFGKRKSFPYFLHLLHI